MDSVSFFVADFLFRLSPSSILIPPPLFAEKLFVSLFGTLSSLAIAYRGDVGCWLYPVFWIRTLVTICFTDSRVCPSMRSNKIYCPSRWSLLVVGQLTLFPSKFSWGISCSVSRLILTPAYVALYSDDVSATTIFAYNKGLFASSCLCGFREGLQGDK